MQNKENLLNFRIDNFVRGNNQVAIRNERGIPWKFLYSDNHAIKRHLFRETNGNFGVEITFVWFEAFDSLYGFLCLCIHIRCSYKTVFQYTKWNICNDFVDV